MTGHHMRITRRSAWAAAGAATAAVLAAGTLVAVGPADAAVTTVPLTVTLVDSAGAPVARQKIYAYYQDYGHRSAETDAQGHAVLRVPPKVTAHLSLWDQPLADTGGAPARVPITVNTGSTGTSTTIVVPARWGRSYQVLDPLDRPVYGAFVDLDALVSTPVTDPVRGTYRMVGYEPWHYKPLGTQADVLAGATGVDGRTLPIQWYEPEPDPAVACPFLTYEPERCDQDADGTPDGMVIRLGQGSDGHPSGVTVPYTQWAVPGSATMTLHVPAVPVVEVVSQRPGDATGEAVLTVRVLKPGASGYVPADGVRLDTGRFWRFAVTNSQGLAELQMAHLRRPATVTVTTSAFAAVAAQVSVEPRLGIGVARARFNPPGKDRRTVKGLNREWITLTNTSVAPVTLTRWTLSNEAGNRYRFGRYTLRPGATVKVHTGPGHDTSTDRYWGSRSHRWAKRDRATLRTDVGTIAARCSWHGGGEGGLWSCFID